MIVAKAFRIARISSAQPSKRNALGAPIDLARTNIVTGMRATQRKRFFRAKAAVRLERQSGRKTNEETRASP
ncbi:MAG: hypothetical protein J0I77_08075 [Rudaea sp.]|uniref:hypothetical protein n=1 Tax=unclassified Rudaea TaxID=2627037 RepID=UPI0010F43791|nr:MULTISPECIES: hypothetical protein [unclassified Rudaea]MBN8885664.1 hypothetical protein [Rudaea sp.]MBR0346376.1 hypothetical protein [Rudaea sp.]